MHRMNRWLAATVLWCTLGPALADDTGAYIQAGAGRTNFDFDCSVFLSNSCDAAHANARKLGGGYRFGIFALEVWSTDWGRGGFHHAAGDDYVHLRSVGVSGAWRIRLGSLAEVVLRAGGAQVQQNRAAESFKSLEATFGVGANYEIVPKVALEIGWDFTSSTGGSDHIGTVFARAVTAGLRVRF